LLESPQADAPSLARPRGTETSSIAGYCVPLFLFGVFTEIETRVPAALYPYAYVAKLCAVMLALAHYRWTLQDLRPSHRVLAPAVLVGLLVFAEWVWLDKWLPYPHVGSRAAFNPLAAFQSPLGLAAFLAVRFWGLVVVVPVMEELFWRAFLIRYLTNTDFTTIPIGQFSAMAFWLVAGFSGLVHPEWLVAVVASAATRGCEAHRQSVCHGDGARGDQRRVGHLRSVEPRLAHGGDPASKNHDGRHNRSDVRYGGIPFGTTHKSV
jgi:CAAX prenyl protease-like protein